ncbi:CBS domain-containing protein [Pinisolibacter aquiterrae]|uniref:CBS domain-containing protein n=1 Tax=Pinisolibacter aquiterrae TaxID=2815579 RepID=UPI001C3E7670|nr:CBS domain-containing protein [Pinisolibacter aquiterrae]MBV5265997.1 CBS domain-containing protein [Pinisolibacter aquiterrae]MCC8237146.1 CBS domain-containing protein [Pinisolibacter aquiterrae]
MTVAAILSQKGRQVVTMGPKQTLREVCETLATHKIGAVVLIDGQGRIAGILSERDIVRALAGEGAAALDRAAESHMSTKVMTCVESETTDKVLGRMTAGRFRHMPVVREDRLIGVISIGDVVARRIELAEQEAAQMRAYIATA